MEIQFIEHQDIDMDKWNSCIDHSVNQLPYANSWYLDTVCPGWNALVGDDYKAVFPLTGRSRFNYHYLFQPSFATQLGLFSGQLLTEDIIHRFIQEIPSFYKKIDINLNRYNNPDHSRFSIIQNYNFELPLIKKYEDLERDYSDTLKKELKIAKESKLAVMPQVNPGEIIRLFQLNKRKHSAKAIQSSEYHTLEQLIYKLAKRGLVDLKGVFTERHHLCAAGVFLKMNDRIIYLFSGYNEEGRQVAAIPRLIDSVVQANARKNLILDFVMAHNAKSLELYKRFGAREVSFPGIKINRLPWYQQIISGILR